MAWVDSEQMWRMETQKRSLASVSDNSDFSFSEPEDGDDNIVAGTAHRRASPVKAARLDQQMYTPPIASVFPPLLRPFNLV